MRNYLSRVALFAGVIALFVVVVGPTSFAQDPNMPPTYGTVFLREGFMPDPYSVNVVAGGPIHTTLGGVSAYVGRAPDFRVHYTAGRSTLSFYVSSSADPTLLINLPDGSWVAVPGNLSYRLPNAPSGQYDIWVGTITPHTPAAVLNITERL